MTRKPCLNNLALRFLATIFLLTPGIVSAGSISGTIRDASTDLPVSTFGSVSLYSSEGLPLGFSPIDNVTGTYNLNGLESGSYFVRTRFEEFLDEVFDDQVCPFSNCDVTIGKPIAVTAGTATENIDFSLIGGSSISGVVLDESTGLAIGGSAGNVVELYDALGFPLIIQSIHTLNGSYTFAGLPSGEYFVRTQTKEYLDEVFDDTICAFVGCDVTAGDSIAVIDGEEVTGIDFSLSSEVSIQGTIREATSGLPIQSTINDVVELFESTGGPLGNTQINAISGDYYFAGLKPGNYFIKTKTYLYLDEVYNDQVCAFTGCDITAGDSVLVSEDSPALDINFELVRGGSIHGVILDASTNLPVSASIHDAVELYGETGVPLDTRSIDVETGTYSFTGLRPGGYFIRTRVENYLDEVFDDLVCPFPVSCTITDGTLIHVPEDTDIEGIDFSLGRGSSITGVVLDATTGLPIPGSIENTVSLHNATGAPLVVRNIDVDTGIYQFPGLESGHYFVRTETPLYIDEVFDDQTCAFSNCNVLKGNPISVATGETTEGIDFELGEASFLFGDSFESGDVSRWSNSTQ